MQKTTNFFEENRFTVAISQDNVFLACNVKKNTIKAEYPYYSVSLQKSWQILRLSAKSAARIITAQRLNHPIVLFLFGKKISAPTSLPV